MHDWVLKLRSFAPDLSEAIKLLMFMVFEVFAFLLFLYKLFTFFANGFTRRIKHSRKPLR
jgi:hypothetical protein